MDDWDDWDVPENWDKCPLDKYLELNGFDSETTRYVKQNLGVKNVHALRFVKSNDLKDLHPSDENMKKLVNLVQRYKTSVAKGEIDGLMTNRLFILLGQLCELNE